MNRLSQATLAQLPAGVVKPSYDPRGVGIGIVHLGIGAFYRAQSAVYTDDALALEGGDWGICGVSLRSPDVRDRLAPQNGIYTAVEKSPAGVRRRVIGSVREVLFLGDERAAIHARLAAPATRIVSLTITEKGYCHDPATGRLNFAHPDIVHDLADAASPNSAIGLIVAALEARRRSHGTPLTILCCDNLPHNGALVRDLVLAFSEARDPQLAHWVRQHASFPSTMVDRIVPATTDADIADNDAALGLHDAAPVMHEPFKQWVVEDNFAAGRPIDRLALGVAGWMRYVAGVDEAGREIKVSDPLAAQFADIAAKHRGDAPALARGLLGIGAIFGTDLPATPQFADKVIAWLTALLADGAERTVARIAAMDTH